MLIYARKNFGVMKKVNTASVKKLKNESKKSIAKLFLKNKFVNFIKIIAG